ncbi:hypothetical protein [Pseudomonas sp. R5(2019)]|uniref:hypothetical protein n=1 Tax=Pseudomonas sp. R5(2019) TaxID=2697566 RepID=UPI00211506F9|nr:hypothetical protein [Pseudomonas sp. R5(2019)]
MMQAGQQVKEALDPLTQEEAEFLYRHGNEIAAFTGQTSTWLGISAVVLEKHVSQLRDTLQSIEQLHQQSYRRHGHLRSTEFFAERKKLMAQLDAQLLNSKRLKSHTSFGGHDKLKSALGISSRSLVHHWNRAGAPGQIPGYAAHVKSISRAMKYMQTGGYIAIGIGGVSSLLAIQEVCNTESGAVCKKVKFAEGSKFAGSAIGGYIGGELAFPASILMCGVLGLTTGVAGVVCVAGIVGTGSLAGSTLGSLGGEFIGEMLYEAKQP